MKTFSAYTHTYAHMNIVLRTHRKHMYIPTNNKYIHYTQYTSIRILSFYFNFFRHKFNLSEFEGFSFLVHVVEWLKRGRHKKITNLMSSMLQKFRNFQVIEFLAECAAKITPERLQLCQHLRIALSTIASIRYIIQLSIANEMTKYVRICCARTFLISATNMPQTQMHPNHYTHSQRSPYCFFRSTPENETKEKKKKFTTFFFLSSVCFLVAVVFLCRKMCSHNSDTSKTFLGDENKNEFQICTKNFKLSTSTSCVQLYLIKLFEFGEQCRLRINFILADPFEHQNRADEIKKFNKKKKEKNFQSFDSNCTHSIRRFRFSFVFALFIFRVRSVRSVRSIRSTHSIVLILCECCLLSALYGIRTKAHVCV